jgi:hypothetical protein
MPTTLWAQLPSGDREQLGRHFSRLLLRAARSRDTIPEGR